MARHEGPQRKDLVDIHYADGSVGKGLRTIGSNGTDTVEPISTDQRKGMRSGMEQMASGGDTTLAMTRACPQCGEVIAVEVPQSGYASRESGASIQSAYPDMDNSVRERFVSGTCPSCWDEMFGGFDEDGDGEPSKPVGVSEQSQAFQPADFRSDDLSEYRERGEIAPDVPHVSMRDLRVGDQIFMRELDGNGETLFWQTEVAEIAPFGDDGWISVTSEFGGPNGLMTGLDPDGKVAVVGGPRVRALEEAEPTREPTQESTQESTRETFEGRSSVIENPDGTASLDISDWNTDQVSEREFLQMLDLDPDTFDGDGQADERALLRDLEEEFKRGNEGDADWNHT